MKKRIALTCAVALALTGGTALLPNAPTADAHVCAQARTHLGGVKTEYGSCHEPSCPSDHMGYSGDHKYSGTGAGVTVCVGL
jgi:hypothetical protein